MIAKLASGMREKDHLADNKRHRETNQVGREDRLAAHPATQSMHRRWPTSERRLMAEESVEIVGEPRRGWITVLRILFEALEANRFHRARQVGDQTARQ